MELYLVIKCGYEGIEELVFPTSSSHDAINKITEKRKNIIDAKQRREKFLDEFGRDEDEHMHDAWDRLYFSECDDDSISKENRKITDEEFENSKWENPHAYCVQKWDNERNCFGCVCKELNVDGGPKETWWM